MHSCPRPTHCKAVAQAAAGARQRPDNPKVCELTDKEFVEYCVKQLENWTHGKGRVVNDFIQNHRDKVLEFTSRKQVDDFLKKFT